LLDGTARGTEWTGSTPADDLLESGLGALVRWCRDEHSPERIVIDSAGRRSSSSERVARAHTTSSRSSMTSSMRVCSASLMGQGPSTPGCSRCAPTTILPRPCATDDHRHSSTTAPSRRRRDMLNATREADCSHSSRGSRAPRPPVLHGPAGSDLRPGAGTTPCCRGRVQPAVRALRRALITAVRRAPRRRRAEVGEFRAGRGESS